MKSETILSIEEIIENKEYNRERGFLIRTNKQEIKVIIDANQQCCEKFGYFFCNDNVQEFVGSELRDIKITDTALNNQIMERNNLFPDSGYFSGDIMFVDLLTNIDVIQFVAYNEHNGYYGHTASVSSNQLNFSTGR